MDLCKIAFEKSHNKFGIIRIEKGYVELKNRMELFFTKHISLTLRCKPLFMPISGHSII